MKRKKKYSRKRTTRKVVYVAKRKRSYRRYSARPRRSYSRKGGIGGMKGLLYPALGGVADSMITNVNIMGFRAPPGLGSLLIGWFGKNGFCKDIGAYQIGASLPSYFGGGTATGFKGQG
jgi:hypothetical protein